LSDDITKRVILSYLSKIFDPIGFSCPALLPLKFLLQSAWLAKSGWDEKLPAKAVAKFKKWHAELSCLQHVSISRDITGSCGHQDSSSYIHFVMQVKTLMQLWCTFALLRFVVKCPSSC